MSYDYDDDSGNSYFQAIGAVWVIIVFLLIFPLVPWGFLGYEIGGHLYNINLVKWGGVIIGALLGVYFHKELFVLFNQL